MRATRGRRTGFTLVELLTVIAIIAILAAIIFPVLGTLRRNVSKSSCLTNLHSIAQAVKMYKDDYRVYPEALYGYVAVQGTVTFPRTFLYPQYITERTGFRCPLNPERGTDTAATRLMDGINGKTGLPMGLRYYVWDSYDGSRVPHQPADPNAPYAVHYLRRWDTVAVGQGDNPRQLIYRYPPDTTVITWCTYHRVYQQDSTDSCRYRLEPGSVDLALFLDGRAKAVPANLMQECQNGRLLDGPAHVITPGI